MPQRMHAPGLLITGDGAGFVNVPALKGIHYAIESGRLAAEAAFRGAPARADAVDARRAGPYDQAIRDTFIWTDLKRVRNMRQPFGHGFWFGSAMAAMATMSFGMFPPGNRKTHRDAEQDLIKTKRASRYPKPDGKLTFDKLSSVFLSGNKTRDDAPNHIVLRTDVPEGVARTWEQMCPAQVYEAKEGGGVEVTPSNCVQCGAITAKGGRLTPPEGGAGPSTSSPSRDSDTSITRDDVLAAREAIAGRLHRTPTFSSATLGPRVHLKAELFQRTGSFKPRGVLNSLSRLSEEERRRGVIAASARNTRRRWRTAPPSRESTHSS